MAGYAKGTSVSVEKSRMEIESTLERFGADQFTYGRDDSRGLAMIQFRSQGRHVRFILTLPMRDNEEFTQSKRGPRTPENAYAAWEQACRERWRALAACIKAKLVAVETNISEFEDEFLAHIVLPNNQTAGEWLRPQLEAAEVAGQMPRTLLALPAPA